MKNITRLKELRKAAGLTQKQVADKLGISQNNYSCMENGKVKIAEKYIFILCGLYDCTKEYLLGEDILDEKIKEMPFNDLVEKSKKAFYTLFGISPKTAELIGMLAGQGVKNFDFYGDLKEEHRRIITEIINMSDEETALLSKFVAFIISQRENNE